MQYDNIPDAPDKPYWTPSPNCNPGYNIIFIVKSEGANVCGVTVVTNAGGIATAANIAYNTNVPYYRGTSNGGCNFDYTTLHEFGHSQGLAHHYGPYIMNPTDNGRTVLTSDEKDGIQFLY